MFLIKKIIYLLLHFWFCQGLLITDSFAIAICQPRLWPTNSYILNPVPDELLSPILTMLKQSANKALAKPIHAMVQVSSAGKTSIADPYLIKSRQAFQDADDSVVLALYYYFTKQMVYLTKCRQLLLAWANINLPTGQPIDESRLINFIWSYDLVACDLSKTDRRQIQRWINKIIAKKRAWHYGPQTINNNHHVQQLAGLLLLDKMTQDNNDWQQQLVVAKTLLMRNLNPDTGESVDYRERHALYYHNYVLQAWLEIALLANIDAIRINRAYQFLISQSNANHQTAEFIGSKAKIDYLRSASGFAYAKQGGRFDRIRLMETMLRYHTHYCSAWPEELTTMLKHSKASAKKDFLMARMLLWQPCEYYRKVSIRW
jgi:hypothetical protein